MTIASEVAKLQSNLEDSYTKVNAKGGTLPQNQCFDNLPDAIDSIVTGGDITSLSISPSTSAQSFSKQGEYDGYNPVTVNPVTASIDPNIKPLFIRNGIEILGVTGSYGSIYIEPYVNSLYQTTWYLTNTGDLYGCGRGDYGQQGSGNTTNVTTFTKRGEGIKEFKSNSLTTWYVTTNGDLYGCGYNANGQQGSGNTTNVTTFTKRGENVKTFVIPPYTEIVTSWYIATNGDLYGCGDNTYGQQGSGNTTTVKTFTKRGENVKEVLPTVQTTWYLTNTGDLYGCGRNNFGQQGNGTSGGSSIVAAFTKRGENVVKFKTSYIDESSNTNNTFYLTNTGDLYGCGYNGWGELGLGNNTTTKSFTKIAENVKDFGTAATATWYIDNNNDLYICGSNTSGQQGNGETSGQVTTFTKRLENVKEVFSHERPGSYGIWAITNNNEIYGTGYDVLSGLCTFTKITEEPDLAKFISPYGSISQVGYITNTGDLYLYGQNNYGQQGDGTTTRVTAFTKRAENVIYYAGQSTSWYINNDLELYGCGYNYFGQQGAGTSGSGTNVLTFTKRADL